VGLSVTQRDDASITHPFIPSLKGGEIKNNPLLLKALRSKQKADSRLPTAPTTRRNAMHSLDIHRPSHIAEMLHSSGAFLSVFSVSLW